ncbi:hypothetical protein TTHERM_001020819 (macronuclear) [Tetrahymena thermophila SB210]|uniref:Uncharacterized protein n=1 Tax=Tetrahymena thermophila (strain SB210) TaxID=312017 RepID=W7X5B9_TETTS|nr:hypothetical protein TTHERM_001020819 [Tetrahymena thermophila SB210]EWS71553.1 hypothetical protein TTHERM_001020819 [Tetrahymena thermophila SB210]|eukprot:XP_012655915.1 hypothetical protein TTHERM_001020819 [Tetrahymena thermophila SB210]
MSYHQEKLVLHKKQIEDTICIKQIQYLGIILSNYKKQSNQIIQNLLVIVDKFQQIILKKNITQHTQPFVYKLKIRRQMKLIFVDFAFFKRKQYAKQLQQCLILALLISSVYSQGIFNQQIFFYQNQNVQYKDLRPNQSYQNFPTIGQTLSASDNLFFRQAIDFSKVQGVYIEFLYNITQLPTTIPTTNLDDYSAICALSLNQNSPFLKVIQNGYQPVNTLVDHISFNNKKNSQQSCKFLINLNQVQNAYSGMINLGINFLNFAFYLPALPANASVTLKSYQEYAPYKYNCQNMCFQQLQQGQCDTSNGSC